MVNLEWYRSFITVYRVGTTSRAAELLFLTQPAVSQHLAALESALNTQLFERTPRKMLPTDAGKRLYNQVAPAIETLEAINAQTNFLQTQQIIRLGTPQEFFSEKILVTLQHDKSINYVIKYGIASELIKLLLNTEIDAVIATQKINNPEIEYLFIYEENFWLVAPPTVEIPTTPLIEWLREQSWIAYSEDLPIIRRFWRVVFGVRIDTNPRLVIPDLRAIRDAVSYGFGLSVLPDYLCRDWVDNKRLTLVLKPSKVVTNQIWLAFRKSEQQTQKIQILQKLLCG
ncbi:LysR family transcriptional regulator [Calothrix sp. HK-06]|nr:LysR family transcriptional regulator [Calothrix sp. HK-06]